MSLTLPAWGALLGAMIALLLLGAVSVVLLTADGSTYKVLVAVWLWLLPVLGLFSGGGYAVGRGAEALDRAMQGRGR